MVPMAGENAVLHASAIEREPHVRAPIVEGVDATLVTDDQDRSMRPAHHQPPLRLEFLERACTHEFGAHDHASSVQRLARHDSRMMWFAEPRPQVRALL